MNHRRILHTFLLPAVALTFLASNLTIADSSFDMYLENDSRLTKPNGNTDRHYTNGIKFVYTTDTIPHWDFLNYLGDWSFGNKPANQKSNLGFFFGQNMYTPDYIDEPHRREPKDMSYAGWLYGGIFMQRSNETRLEHTELNFGVIGPSAQADETQEFIHDVLGSVEAIGWETQIGDEMAFDFKYNIRDKIDLPFIEPSEKYDFLAEYGLTAGTVNRNAELGLIFRYGINLAGDFGPGRLNNPISQLNGSKASYAFVRVNGKYVEHNRFLTGLSEEPFLGSLQLGLVYQYNSLKIGYSQTFFTQEFEEQKGRDSFGEVIVSWAF